VLCYTSATVSQTDVAFVRRIGTRRCLLTPADAAPPYVVIVTEGDTPIIEQSFDAHGAAYGFALQELRRAAKPQT
jgi:hypothetical protein